MVWENENDYENDRFRFDLHPNDADFEEVMEDFGNTLKELRSADADVDEWFDATKLDKLASDPDGDISGIYAKIICKGFRRFISKSNISVTVQKNRSVRVEIRGLKRLILLACVRRIKMECDAVILFSPDKFSVISKFRTCPCLMGLVPSDVEIAEACGIEL